MTEGSVEMPGIPGQLRALELSPKTIPKIKLTGSSLLPKNPLRLYKLGPRQSLSGRERPKKPITRIILEESAGQCATSGPDSLGPVWVDPTVNFSGGDGVFPFS